jgi:broad specificity phosphatase PhoE
MSEKRILIARHPETEANVKGLWTGRGNTPFTELGLWQVETLSGAIAAFEPDGVWSSPLERTMTVAGRVADALRMEVRVDARLTELDFGAAEGLTLEEASARGIAFDFKAEDAPVAEGGESRRDILDRTAAVVDEILAASDRAAVLTHGGVVRSALVHLLGLPLHAIWAFHVRNAQIAEVSVVEGLARLEVFRQV